jgi:hypothetical protein
MELRALAERDAELAARRAALAERDSRVAEIRRRAEEIESGLATQPAEQVRRDAELDEAHAELDRPRHELAEAEGVLAAAGDDEEAREHARHGVDRALDHIAVAQSRVDRAEAARDELARETRELPRELNALEERARSVPEVPALVDSLVDWASRAHAEIFVAGGQIDTQRDRIIREANELASMLLGEPTYGSTPGQALARVVELTSARGRKD